MNNAVPMDEISIPWPQDRESQYHRLLDLRQQLVFGQIQKVRDQLQVLLSTDFEYIDASLAQHLFESSSTDKTILDEAYMQLRPENHTQTVLSDTDQTLLERVPVHQIPTLSGTVLDSTPQVESDSPSQHLQSWITASIRSTLLNLANIAPEKSAESVFDKELLFPFETQYPDLVIKSISFALQKELACESVSLIGQGNMGWVFVCTNDDGQKRVAKVPKPHTSDQSLELYDQEIEFFQNYHYHLTSHHTEQWFPAYHNSGHLNIDGRSFLYGVFDYCYGPIRLNDKNENSDAVMSLAEIIPIFSSLHPGFSLLLVEHMLLALFDFQSTMSGIIHRDLKPDNYFLHFQTASLLWNESQINSDFSDSISLQKLWNNLQSIERRILTNDFGLVIEMEPNLFDPVTDDKGEVILGLTPRYANIGAILKNGPYAHSDRYSIACILYEMISGENAQSGRERTSKIFTVPDGLTNIQQEVMRIAVRVLNDEREQLPHVDNEKEWQITKEFLEDVQRHLHKYSLIIAPGFFRSIFYQVINILKCPSFD
ncbi:MAG: hypothetical protein P1V18_00240 [Candidatus Gracilibacteria bacterium]|nr:hypothetical protein [Candidatus Gracilibacteria bacterium]